jgi:hypothetical protein
MKSLIKLLIAALIANATWRIGSEYLSYYKFKDSVREFTQHRASKNESQIRGRIMELATQYDVPLDDDSLTITHVNNHTIVDGSYVKPIDVVPTFRYNWPFKFHIDTYVVDPEQVFPR